MNKKNVFLRIGDDIFKLEINVDNEALLDLKNEIILNCSKIENIRNKPRTGYSLPHYRNDEHYRNVSINITQREYHDTGYGDDDKPEISTVSYDYYDYPAIVNKISEILFGKFGNERGFNISFNSSTSIKENKTIESIFAEIKQITSDTTISPDSKAMKLYQLASQFEEASQIQTTSTKIEDYYERIFACFNFENIETISVLQLQTFLDFIQENNFESKIIQIDDLDPILQKFVFKEIEYNRIASDIRKKVKKIVEE